jgi:hypothetical protein
MQWAHPALSESLDLGNPLFAEIFTIKVDAIATDRYWPRRTLPQPENL